VVMNRQGEIIIVDEFSSAERRAGTAFAMARFGY